MGSRARDPGQLEWRRARSDGQAVPNDSSPPKPKRDEWANVGWHGGGANDLLEGAARYALLNMPQPVAAADPTSTGASRSPSSGRPR